MTYGLTLRLLLGLAGLQAPAEDASAPPEWVEARVAAIPEDVAPIDNDVLGPDSVVRALRQPFVWSDDGRRVAWVGQRGAKLLPFVNGEPVQDAIPYASDPQIVAGRTLFTLSEPLEDGRAAVSIWIDGELLGPEDGIGPVAVGPDGDRLAYWVHPGARYGNVGQASSREFRLVIATEGRDGAWTFTRSDDFRGQPWRAPLFRADGQGVLTWAEDNAKQVVLSARGTRPKPVGRPRPVLIDLLARGDLEAWIMASSLEGSRELWVGGKQVEKRREGFALLAADAAGERLAFVERIEDGERVCLLGERQTTPTWDHVVELVVADRGERLAFLANSGGRWVDDDLYERLEGGTWHLVTGASDALEDVEVRSLDGPARDLALDPTGARAAWAERSDGPRGALWSVRSGDAVEGPFQTVSAPRFAADGKRIGFGAQLERELWWRVLELD